MSWTTILQEHLLKLPLASLRCDVNVAQPVITSEGQRCCSTTNFVDQCGTGTFSGKQSQGERRAGRYLQSYRFNVCQSVK